MKTHNKGGVLATEGSGTHRTRLNTQIKGGVFATKAVENTQQRRCPRHEGSGTHRRCRYLLVVVELLPERPKEVHVPRAHLTHNNTRALQIRLHRLMQGHSKSGYTGSCKNQNPGWHVGGSPRRVHAARTWGMAASLSFFLRFCGCFFSFIGSVAGTFCAARQDRPGWHQ